MLALPVPEFFEVEPPTKKDTVIPTQVLAALPLGWSPFLGAVFVAWGVDRLWSRCRWVVL